MFLPSFCPPTGAVELENLPLRRDALREFNLPFEVKAGWLHSKLCFHLWDFVLVFVIIYIDSSSLLMKSLNILPFQSYFLRLRFKNGRHVGAVTVYICTYVYMHIFVCIRDEALKPLFYGTSRARAFALQCSPIPITSTSYSPYTW